MKPLNAGHNAFKMFFTLCVTIATLAVPSLLEAQQDRDLNELEHCTLTMDKINRLAGVFSDLGEVAKAHPELKDALAHNDDKHQSIGDIEQQLATIPQVKTVIVKHGFSTREFVVVQFAFFQSAMASAMIKPGPDQAKLAAQANVNPANLEFIRQHQAELEKIMKKIGAAGSASE